MIDHNSVTTESIFNSTWSETGSIQSSPVAPSYITVFIKVFGTVG